MLIFIIGVCYDSSLCVVEAEISYFFLFQPDDLADDLGPFRQNTLADVTLRSEAHQANREVDKPL